MRIAYINCFSGIAGDMTVAALLDAGLDFGHLREELAKLGLEPEYRLRRSTVMRHSIAATKFDVLHPDADTPIDGGQSSAKHDHNHSHDHGQTSAHADAGHHHGDSHAHSHGPHRGLSDVSAVIERARLSPAVTERAIAIFTRLAEAEAAMHNSTPDKVHFHEVGAVDALVDIVGACIGIEALGIEKVYSSPIRVGSGQVKAAHGVLPVPAPGTLELLKGVPVEHTDLPFEMVTPTGAAIITTIASAYGPPPVFIPERVGYGAGGRDPKQIANLLRIEIGETAGSAVSDEVVMIETNLDDMNPEVYGHLMDRLFEAGARDVYLEQVIMKKGRPGIVLHVLADAATRDALTGLIFDETPTLGVRMTPMQRRILSREAGAVETKWGSIRVKRAEWNGRVRVTPEYDDCAAIARKHEIPILDVYEAVRRAAGQ